MGNMVHKIHTEFMLFFTIIVMAVLAFIREVIFFPIPDLIPNPDTAWLIYAAKRFLEGQKLYVDILETNPPLIIWISTLPVMLGNLLHISSFQIFSFLVTILNLCSIFLIAVLIRKQVFFSDKINYSVVILYISFALFLMSPAVYGQRELLFIALVLPYLFLSLSSIIRRPLSVLVIFMAAIGFAIKPFFMLLWGLNELHIAVEKRRFRTIFAWHNWFIGAVQITYFTSIYYFTPEYITEILPVLQVTYFTFNSPLENLLSPIIKIAGAAIAVVFLAKLKGEYLRIVLRMSVWLFACIGLIIVQRKEWINHLYPMTFMTLLIISIVLLYLIKEWKSLNLDIGYQKFIALCVSVSLLVAAVYLDSVFTHNMFVKPSKLSEKLLIELETKAKGRYIYPLANNIQPAFPVFSLSGAVFHGGFHQLWPVMGLLVREQQGDNSEEFLAAKKWFIDKIVRDFTNYPPYLVIVDDNVNMEIVSTYPVNPENRNIIDVLSRDGRFARIWHNYEKYKEIESESYPDEEEAKTEEEKMKKPEHYSLYIRKNGK